MSEQNIEFKVLESKVIGSDTVIFRLDDGTMVKVKIDMARAAIAVNFRNPDGSPYYLVNLAPPMLIFNVTDKRFFIPKTQLNMQQSPPKESTMKPV